MTDTQEFSFGDDAVASAYDNTLVPILFKPWAARLISDYQPWEGRRVLDLATGTGIVAQQIAELVGPNGKVLAADINRQMLDLAANRCADSTPAVEFIESPAHSLDVTDNSIDFVVCQQGFQFFPDKRAAVKEIYRVLCDKGQVVVTTWCPVFECPFFGAICNSLTAIGERSLSDMMRIPFDVTPPEKLAFDFESVGFENVRSERQEQDFLIEGGIAQAVRIAYSTPIGPKLRDLPDERQAEFRLTFTELLTELSPDGINMGRMVSNVLSAAKPLPG